MIFCMVLFLASVVTVLLLGKNLLWALLIGLGLFFGLGLRSGHSPRELASMAWKKGRESLIVVPIFLLIGTVTALWRASGTISFFLYYGLNGIPARWFVLVAFVLSALLSFTLGTTYGVCGTAGVVLLALARSGGVSVPLTAGAVLSGAFFGDRSSPMSSCATLVAACTRTDLYSNVREMLKTAALPMALTTAVFAAFSLQNPIAVVDPRILSVLRDNFSLGLPVLIPAALMLVLPLFRVPVKWSMAASALSALILSATVQHMPLSAALLAALRGYAPEQSELSAILSGGGVVSMLTSSGVVLVTSLYSGILEGIDALSPVRARVERLCARAGLFPAAIAVSVLVVAIFCNQSVMVIMDTQLLRDSYDRRGRPGQELAMDIANSGVTLSGLIPWSIAQTVPLAMLGADISAVPYAVLLYLIPLCYFFTKKYFAPAQSPGAQ